MKFFLLIFTFIAFTSLLYGQVIVTPTTTPGNCPADGGISVTATGTTGTVYYAIKKTTDAIFSPQQAGNIFYNLASGTYLVAVYDASGTTISSPISLTNAPYTAISVSSTTVGNTVVTACDPDGSINLAIAGGRAPYTYHLKGGPTVKADVVSSLKLVSFTQLETGTYAIDITDACGSTFTASGLAVTSKFNLSGITLGSLDGMKGPTPSSTGCDGSITFSTNNIILKDISNNVLFASGGTHMPAPDYPVEIRVEYPEGSGTWTPWQNVFSSFDLPNYRPDKNTYKVEMRHPCNPTNVVVSPAYTTIADVIPYPYQTKSGFCAPTVYRVIDTYNCGPIDIELTRISGTGALSKSYTWDGTGDSYLLDLTGLDGTYSVKITTDGYTYPAANVKTVPSASVTLAPTLEHAANLGCSFTTGGIRSYMSGFPADNTVPITYTIISGPATRDPVTGLQPFDDPVTEPLFRDLPPGTYQVRVDYGDCRTETKTVNVTTPYSGFDATELSYVAGTSCGKYKITGKGWYIKTVDGTVLTGTALYSAKILNSNGSYGASSVDMSSNSDFIINTDVVPGTYTVAFQNKASSDNRCHYITRTITIPPYTKVTIDVDKSGGVICSGNVGTLHVETVGDGSGLGITYRVKVKAAADATYSGWQSSPDFPGLSGGEYTVQVNDACGYLIEQALTLKVVPTTSTINVSGATLIGSGDTAIACHHNEVTLDLQITGDESNMQWTNPLGGTQVGKSYLLEDYQSVHTGKYYIDYDVSVCHRRDSMFLKLNPLPTATISGTATVCMNTAAPQITFTGADATAPYTFTYNINGESNITVTTAEGSNSVTVSAPTNIDGTFVYNLVSVQEASSTACQQAQTSNATVTVNPLPTATFSNNTAICNGESSTLTISLTGTAPWTIVYNMGTGDITIPAIASTPYELIVTPSATTTYTITRVEDVNCINSAP